jgi:hypothetical protein
VDCRIGEMLAPLWVQPLNSWFHSFRDGVLRSLSRGTALPYGTAASPLNLLKERVGR